MKLSELAEADSEQLAGATRALALLSACARLCAPLWLSLRACEPSRGCSSPA